MKIIILLPTAVLAAGCAATAAPAAHAGAARPAVTVTVTAPAKTGQHHTLPTYAQGLAFGKKMPSSSSLNMWCDQNDPSPPAISANDARFVPNGQYGLAGNQLGTYEGSPWWVGCMNAQGPDNSVTIAG